jgi:hypothetical protein
MDIRTIKQQPHNYPGLNDRKIKVGYTLVEVEEYSEVFKAELDYRYAEYKKDGKVISRGTMDIRIKKALGKPS